MADEDLTEAELMARSGPASAGPVADLAADRTVEVGEPLPALQSAREGNAELIRGVGIFDTPDPGTGNLLMSCTFPGNGALVVYPGSEVCIDTGALEIFIDDAEELQVRARPKAAAIELKGDEIHFHPPAVDPLPRAIARVCEQFKIDIRDTLAVTKLLAALITKHYPEALQPAGRERSNDERAMSIAWVVDQERRDDEASPEAIRRARPKLLAYGLIESSLSDRTLERLFREGEALLRRRGMKPWRKRGQGRPQKNRTAGGC